jgi:hypothetical protein
MVGRGGMGVGGGKVERHGWGVLSITSSGPLERIVLCQLEQQIP